MKVSHYSGHENLEVLSSSHRFNNWIYEEISPWLKGDVLEIGSGTGTISEKIIGSSSSFSKIMLTDVSMSYVQELNRRFSTPSQAVESSTKNGQAEIIVRKLDLNQVQDYEKIGYGRFDSIVAINVLEHVENDELALQHLNRMMRRDGFLILLVPCHKFLYNALDKTVGHFRRYSKSELIDKLNRNQFLLQNIIYFNTLGIIGWYISGNLLHKTIVSNKASRVFDRIVPVSRAFENIIGNRIGLSIICCASKKS